MVLNLSNLVELDIGATSQAALAFVAVIMVLVVVHELGHFLTAKLAGVTVQEFGIGYPPRLLSVRFGETRYSLNLLPLGGFVRLLGERNRSDPRSFASQPVFSRLAILAAGPLMSAVLPVVLLTAALMIPQRSYEGPVRVASVAAGSPAAEAGLQPGDIILSINGRPIRLPRDVRYQVNLNLGAEMAVTIRRDEETSVIRLVPRWETPDGQTPVGMTAAMRREEVRETMMSLPLPEALVEGARRTLDMITLVKNGFHMALASDSGAALAGPIGIAQMTGEVAQGGVLPLLQWTAFLSLNLAIMNILPIPALDGGRIAFVLLEWVRRGRRLAPQREGFAQLVGLACLIALFLLTSVSDVRRILEDANLFP